MKKRDEINLNYERGDDKAAAEWMTKKLGAPVSMQSTYQWRTGIHNGGPLVKVYIRAYTAIQKKRMKQAQLAAVSE